LAADTFGLAAVMTSAKNLPTKSVVFEVALKRSLSGLQHR